MNRKRIGFLILMIALLAFPTTLVFAKELGLLTIAGPGIKGEVSLSNHDDMMNLEQSGLFDQVQFVKPPENPGQGYSITAHLNLDGKLVPAIEMVYYPAEEGQAGYVHYTGRIMGETMKPVDEWGQMRPEAETALRNIMTANKIAIQPAIIAAPAVIAPAVVEPARNEEQTVVNEPVSAPASIPKTVPPQTSYIVATLILLLITAGAGFVVRRRTMSQRRA